MKFFLPKLSLIFFVLLLSACGGGSDADSTAIPPTPSNTTPTISGTPFDLINIDSEYNFTPTAEDADGDTLTFSVENKPAWLQLDSATGQLLGTPTEQDAQNYTSIKITVSDSNGAKASLTEFDLLVNSAPVASISAQSFYLEGKDVTIHAINSFDVDGHDFTYAWQQTGGPSVILDSASQSSISFLVPLIELSETVNFTLTVTDAYGAQSTEAFAFTIDPDEIPPTVGDFVLLISGEPTEVTLAWLPAVDNASPEVKIQYQLHASEIELFTPEPSTLVGSYLGETSATVTGLKAGTLYYFQLLVTDSAGNEAAQDNYADFTTVSLSAARTSAEVNEAISLNLGSLEISGSDKEIYTFMLNQNTQEPVIDSFLIGEDKNGEGYLRKVLGVTNNQTALVIVTSQASLADILETAQISSKIHLRSVADEQGVTKTITKSKSVLSNKTKPILTWKDQLLSITEIGALPQTSRYSAKQAYSLSKNRLVSRSTPIETRASAGITLTGEFFFEPVVTSDISWSLGTIESYEAEVVGHFSFDGSIAFDFAGSAEITEQKEVLSRTYISRYIIGGVPVYQESTLTLSAIFTATAETAISASVDNHLSTQVSFNTVYENGEWNDTTNSDYEKSLTVTAEVQGSVSAEIRLIPEVKLRFYRVASIAVSVEPSLSGVIEAEAVTQVDLINQGTLSEYSFTKFDSSIGIDVNFYTDLTIFLTTIARYPESGVKNLYTHTWHLFGLPTLNITTQGPPSIHSPMIFDGNSTAFINEFGTTNPIVESSLSWATFPDNSSGTGTRFNWQPNSHGEIYSTYFIGNSEELGDIGQQFLIKEIDMRDSDADGMPNAWETYYGFNSQSASDADTDFDLDGISNLDEYIAGTNPKDRPCLEGLVDSTRTLEDDIGEYLGLADAFSLPSYDTTVSYFTARQSSDGSWNGYLSRAEGYNNGVLQVSNNYQTFDYADCYITQLQQQTTFESNGTKLEEPYVVHQNPNEQWIAVKEGIAIFYNANGAVNTETTYAAILHGDGYWQSVIEGNAISYYASGEVLQEQFYAARQRPDGFWLSLIEGDSKFYYENGVVKQLTPYVIKENDDGSWISIIVGDIVQKFNSGVTDFIQPYVDKQDSDGVWQGVQEGIEKQYYESDAIKIETPFVARQNDDGRWVTIVNGLGKFYFENGVVSIETPYVAILNNGIWLGTVEGIVKKYYQTDIIMSEEPFVTKQDIEGTWESLYDGIVINYNTSGIPINKVPYMTLQSDDGYWQSIIVGNSRLYYDTGTLQLETNLVAKQLNNGWWISVRDGQQKDYHANGQLVYTVLFVATKQPNEFENWVGLRQGFETRYYSTGKLSNTTPYVIKIVDGFWDDVIDGTATWYREDGIRVFRTRQYRDDLLHGLTSHYDEDGNLTSTMEYNNGVLIETCSYDMGESTCN